MLAGNAAAAGEALEEDFFAGREDPFYFFRVTLIEQEDRVEIAVAGVEDVDDADLVLRADFADAPEDVRQLSARNDAVLRAVAGAEAADRAEGLLAGLPKLQPLFRVGSEARSRGAEQLLGVEPSSRQ